MRIDIHAHTCRARHAKLTRPNGSRYSTPEEKIIWKNAVRLLGLEAS